MTPEKPIVEAIPRALSIYDIFGYLVPGSVTLGMIFLFNLSVGSNTTPTRVLHLVHTEISGSGDLLWLYSFIFMIALLIGTYTLGHLVASLSSLVIDRTLVCKGHGYPYAHLLGISTQWDKDTMSKMNSYRGMFFWLNFLLVFNATQIWHPVPILYRWWGGPQFNTITVVILLISVLGFILSQKGWSKTATAFAAPYNVIFELVNRLLRLQVSLGPEMIARYKETFERRFNLTYNTQQTNNFWLAYSELVYKAPRLAAMAINWRNLYGFSRNMATSFYVVAFYIICWNQVHERSVDLPLQLTYEMTPIILIVLAFGLLVRYYYLYVAYFSRFVFRAFIYINCLESSSELATTRVDG